jgi:nitrous oxide reductase accessory protein NosL
MWIFAIVLAFFAGGLLGILVMALAVAARSGSTDEAPPVPSGTTLQLIIGLLLIIAVAGCDSAQAASEERPCVEQLPVLPRVPQCG